MNANGFKDEAAGLVGLAFNVIVFTVLKDLQEDGMKPALDQMTTLIVGALSGEARAFYDREFAFFSEVTSISGKLKPFIKKTKPEKKVCESSTFRSKLS